MPSKGSRRVTVRLEPHLEQRILATIDSNNRVRHDQPWNLSDWIRDAIVEKLQHQERAKLQREKRSLTSKRKRELAVLALVELPGEAQGASPSFRF